MPVIRRDDIDIHYETAGTGPSVVLLHSLLCDGSMWSGQVGPLSERYRVINVDARGHGRSSRIDSAFSMDDAVDDVAAVLDAEGVERAVWAGLSMGGMAALRAALTCPDRIRALILFDTHGGREPPLQRAKFQALALAVRILGVRPLAATVAKEMFGATTLRSREQLVRDWKSQLVRAHVPSALRTLEAILRRDDLTQRLHEISVPALVGVGIEDHTQPPARARRLAADLPNATYVEIEDAGHLSALEQPQAVTTAMVAFLDGMGNDVS